MTAAPARHSGAVHWQSWTPAAEDRWHERRRPGRSGAVDHLQRLPGRDLHPAAGLAPRVTAAPAARQAPEADPGRGGEAVPAQAVAGSRRAGHRYGAKSTAAGLPPPATGLLGAELTGGNGLLGVQLTAQVRHVGQRPEMPELGRADDRTDGLHLP